MRTFSYTAYTAEGKRTRGVIIAETGANAGEKLKAQGLFATEISARKAVSTRRGLSLRGVGRFSSDMRMVFTRQMAVLLSADLPSDAALDAVRNSGSATAMDHFASQVKASLLDGQPLSAAIEGAGGGFAPYYTAAIRAGETAGNIASVFEELATHLESVGTDRAQVSTALIYPAFVAAIALVVCAILMVNVAPEIVAMFEVSGQPLPQLTQRVLAVSDWIQRNFYTLIGVVAAIVIGVPLLLRVPSIHHRWDSLRLRLPVVGRLLRLGAAAQYLRTLALILTSRQTVLDAVKGAGDVLSIQRFQNQSDRVADAVRSGESLSSALQHLSLTPPVARQLIEAGESSARLARMSERAAVMTEDMLSNERKRIAVLIEPILMMIVGGLVLMIVLSVLLPIFDLQAVVTQ